VKVVIAGALFQCLSSPCVHGKGEIGICYHLEIGSKNQKFLEHLKLNWLNSCNDSFSCQYDTHTAQEPDSLFGHHAVMTAELAVH